jgi:hypothetical protein
MYGGDELPGAGRRAISSPGAADFIATRPTESARVEYQGQVRTEAPGERSSEELMTGSRRGRLLGAGRRRIIRLYGPEQDRRPR